MKRNKSYRKSSSNRSATKTRKTCCRNKASARRKPPTKSPANIPEQQQEMTDPAPRLNPNRLNRASSKRVSKASQQSDSAQQRANQGDQQSDQNRPGEGREREREPR